MSHMKRMKTKSSFELSVIKRLCADEGWKFMENQKTYKWFGRWMGDSPLPEGMTVEEIGHCNHAIQVPGCSYEIGLVEMGDKVDIRFDFWHSGGLDKAIGVEGQIFRKLYSFTKAKIACEYHGKAYQEETLENGARKLVVFTSGGGDSFGENPIEGGMNW